MTTLFNNYNRLEKQVRLISDRRAKKTAHTEFLNARHAFDKKFRELERKFKRDKFTAIEELETNNPKSFWEQINNLGPKKPSKIPEEVYDESGNIIYDRGKVLEKWMTDFKNLYNNQPGGNLDDTFINEVKKANNLNEMTMMDPLYDPNIELKRNLTLEEVTVVVMKSKNKKSAGIDKLPNELFKNENIILTLKKFISIVPR